MSKYLFPKKSELKQIKISNITYPLPNLKTSTLSKVEIISEWLSNWIKNDLVTGKIEKNNILPSKADLAYKLGVSIGTVQNALRKLEDYGVVYSKQCIGTLVKDVQANEQKNVRKLISKRELAINAIKRFIVSENIQIDANLPSTKFISSKIGYSQNTTRMALEYLQTSKIIKKDTKDSNFVLMSKDFTISCEENQQTETLVDMVVKDLEDYINKNLSIGDKLPPHEDLSNELKASIKTVHDALNILKSKGIILSRRGRYGSSVMQMPNSESLNTKQEDKIFAPAKDAVFYHYEKTQENLKRMIASEYQIGDKIPSILELSKKLDLSPNTIRKALNNLSKEGYLVFSRGRYGGTFVIDIPDVEPQTFKWLAINPSYVANTLNRS